MTAYYTLVQYLPDPLAEERMNIGVIAWDDKRVLSRFLSNWDRVRPFGRENIGFLRDFAKQIGIVTSKQLRLPGIGKDGKLDSEQLKKMISSWHDSIQFTEARGSLKDAENLLRDVAPIFLREPPPRAKRARGRRVAANKAAGSLLAAIQQRAMEEPKQYVKRDIRVEGKLAEHRYDVALANGRLYSAAQALSFEINEPALRKEIDVVAWALDDVANEHPDLPLAVVVLGPRTQEQKRLYREALHVFEGLNARIVTEGRLKTWAIEQAKSI